MLIPLGEALGALVDGFYGSNNESRLSGGMLGLRLLLGDGSKPGVYLFYEAGRLSRKEGDYADTGYGYAGGMGVAIPISPGELWVSGMYLAELFGTNPAVMSLSAGICVTFGAEHSRPSRRRPVSRMKT